MSEDEVAWKTMYKIRRSLPLNWENKQKHETREALTFCNVFPKMIHIIYFKKIFISPFHLKLHIIYIDVKRDAINRIRNAQALQINNIVPLLHIIYFVISCGKTFVKLDLTPNDADTAVVKADRKEEKAKTEWNWRYKTGGELKKGLEGVVLLSGTTLV